MSRGGFNLDDYEPVEDRISKFWSDHPTGRIETTLIEVLADGPAVEFVVHAQVFRTDDADRPAATGLAHEVVGQGMVNKTSALENCETSAIGRALANLGYATRHRPSREEMTKATRPDRSPSLVTGYPKAWPVSMAVVALKKELVDEYGKDRAKRAWQILFDNGDPDEETMTAARLGEIRTAIDAIVDDMGGDDDGEG